MRVKISRREWLRLGGMENPLLWRRQRGKHWEYYRS